MKKEVVPEWADQYIQYRQLKKLLKADEVAMIRQKPQQEQEHLSPFFWNELEASIQKVNRWYKEKEKESSLVFAMLLRQCSALGLLGNNNYEFNEEKIRESKKLSVLRRRAAVEKSISHSSTLSFRKSVQGRDGETPLESVVSSSPTKVQQKLISDSQKQRAERTLKSSFLEFYRGLCILNGFCSLNSVAIRKILKKYEKGFGENILSGYMERKVKPLPFFEHTELSELIEETETAFSEAFVKGDRHDAMKLLRLPEESKKLQGFQLGLFLGISLPLILLLLVWLFKIPSEKVQHGTSIFIVYRMIGLCILLVWSWGIDMLCWKHSNIDHIFIFQFDPRNHISSTDMLTASAVFTCIWITGVFLYLLMCWPPEQLQFLSSIPFQVFPLSLLLITVIVFIFYQIKTGAFLLKILLRIIISPFSRVGFSDFFIADQLVSLAVALYDIEFVLCYFSYDAWEQDTSFCVSTNKYFRPILSALPSLLRFLQCIRRTKDTKSKVHLINSGKYATSIIVTIFAALKASNSSSAILLVFWIFSALCSTIYSLIWDIKMDWGLMQYGTKNKFLRNHLVFRRHSFYYLAMIGDLVLRFVWVLTISPNVVGVGKEVTPEAFTAILASIEIVRRGIWNIFRVENEHIQNCLQFKVTKDLSLPLLPITKDVEESTSGSNNSNSFSSFPNFEIINCDNSDDTW